jgi:hypothetical protein
MANSRRPPSALRVPSLAPTSPQGFRSRYVSGEYAVDRARPAAPPAPARSFFDTEAQPGQVLELERKGPISGPKDSPSASSREMDKGDFDDEDSSTSVFELQMDERSAVRAIPPPPPASLRRPTLPSAICEATSALHATDTRAVIAAFAGFGAPPTTLFQTPGYALHVLRRRRELASDLAYAKRGRSPDVALFASAMNAYEASAARAGWTILGALAFAFVALSFAALLWI